jgi:DNA-binding CsgD family transcriptional regulator/PAS domain-containing protein
MSESNNFSRLVGDIYDATLDPVLWPRAMEDVAHFVGGQAAGLILKDSVSKTGMTHHQFGVDSHYLELYRETYSRFDPLAPLFFCDIGEVSSRTDYLSDKEFFEGRFHAEWAKPQRWIDAANVVLEKSATSFALLSVMRDEASGMVDEDMRRRVGLISPHLQRASLIGKAIDAKAGEAATFADMLDGLSAGVILVDAGGRIVHANAAAEGMLRASTVLHSAAGRLAAIHTQSDHALRDVLSAACGGDETVGVKGIALPLTASDGDLYLAHVLAMTSGDRRGAGARHGAVAAVFVRRATLGAPAPPEVIARSYMLTPSELRVLLAIVEVGGVPETADTLGIGAATVKTHLHRLFAKTGTSRQADLVKVVAGFSNPLMN